MAAADWRSRLNERTFCKKIRENNAKDAKRTTHSESKCLIAVNVNDLFIWDNSASCLTFFNLLNLSHSLKERHNRFQTLKCTDSPNFLVDWLVWNNTKTHLALWGQLGVTVLELPQKFGKFAEFEGGKDVVLCKSTQIGSYYFSSNQNVKLLQLSWHPGSQADNHVAILTSDNHISIYDILEPESPTQVISLSTVDCEPSYSMSLTQNAISSALGDYVTCFDFGPAAVEVSKKSSSVKANHGDTHTVWPMYCVRGNGDVLEAFSDLSARPIKLPVQGPLLMHPQTEDNYGTDACAILCLQSTPTVVVIATCDGKLHHGILLPKDSENSTLQSVSSYGSVKDTCQYDPPEEMLLHVSETVELELTLNTPQVPGSQMSVEDIYTCPIRLIKDTSSGYRYHCSHAAGVHSLVLPWVTKFERFLFGEDEEEVLPSHQSSVVEHLICTKPLPNSPNSPVLGLAQVKDTSIGTILLTLSSDYEFQCLRLSDMRYFFTNDSTLSSSHTGRTIPSPLRKISREPFDNRIKHILQRTASNPLLKSGSNTDISQQDCFQLLSRATQVFREEYIQKQDIARQEIRRRVDILKGQKLHQDKELGQLQASRNILSDKAEQLANSLEDCKETQKDILKRVENIMRKLQARVPFLSNAERGMKRELESIDENLDVLKRNLSQVRMRKDYQQKQMQQAERTHHPSPILKKNQMSQLKQVIKQESDDVQELMKKINQLKMDSSLT